MMASNSLNRMIVHLRRTALSREGAGLTDGELLGQYVLRRDEAAFEGLLRRHGPMVLGVCRRILGNESDAEDAFQATFLVFIRKASSIRCRAQLGNWLYGVAHHTALKARAMRSQRRRKEQVAAKASQPQAAAEVCQQVQILLDAELSHLPDKYRLPIVLCELEGRTIKETARHLGCPQGTVATRLARGRALLARRLSKHGLELSGGVLAALLAQNQASACLPGSLVASALNIATSVVQGTTTGVISPRAAALAEGVLKAMLLHKLKHAVFPLFVAAALIGTVGQGAHLLPLPSAPAGRGGDRKEDPPSPLGHASPRPVVLPAGDPVYRLAWGPGGDVMATVSLTYKPPEGKPQGNKQTGNVAQSTLKLWDMKKSELRLSRPDARDVRIESVDFSPDGKTIALAAKRHRGDQAHMFYEVQLLDAQTGQPLKSIVPAGTIRRVAFSPDGKSLAMGGQYIPLDLLEGPFVRTVQMWDLQVGKVSREFKQELGVKQLEQTGTADGLRDLAFSPDGRLLAAADADWKVRLLDVPTGKLLHTLAAHRSVVISLAFSPDGKTLVSAGYDGAIRVWDVASGKEQRTLRGNQAVVANVVFSPDGKLLASGGAVNSNGKMTAEAVLWDTGSWKSTPLLQGQEGRISALAFSPDGKRLALAMATEAAGEVRILRLADLDSAAR